jgi:WS/DGAT/MGAT family acyltransferase
MRQLTSLDAQFLALEDGRTHGHVSVLGLYDPLTISGARLDVALVRGLIRDRLHALPPLRWRLATVPLSLDHPYWVDEPAVDIEYHVRELALPAPGDRRQLAEQVARIISRPLDRSRPLWELYVIEGLDDGSVALLMKLHHAAVDGVSGAEVLSVLLDDTPEGRAPITEAPTIDRHPGGGRMLAWGLAGVCRQPVRALAGVPGALAHLDSVPTIRPLPGVKKIANTTRRIGGLVRGSSDRPILDLSVPGTRFQAPVSPHRRVAFGSLSLAEVKEVKNAFGCTVNDVVMAMCAGALRDWLSDRGELPDQPLVAFVPMSVRTPEQVGTYGNRVSVMLSELPTDEADTVGRLRRVSDAMQAAKARQRALPPSLLEDANDLIPPAIFGPTARATMRLLANPTFEPTANVAISNVPGSPRPLYCAGARQRAQYPISGVLDGMGLNITVFSYRDRLEIGIVVDREQLDDPWPLLQAIDHGLAQLLDQAHRHTGATAPAEVAA